MDIAEPILEVLIFTAAVRSVTCVTSKLSRVASSALVGVGSASVMVAVSVLMVGPLKCSA